MGTSKRNIDDKIKKMLKQKSTPQEIEQVIPEITVEILTKKKINNFFSDKEYETVIGAGIKGISSLLSGNFMDDYSYEGDIATDTPTIQRIIEAILVKVEEDQSIQSDFLLRALKYALAVSIKDGTEEEKFSIFINEFTYYILYLMISESIIEALGDEFTESPTSEIDQKIKQISRHILNAKLKIIIDNYLSGEVTLEELIKSTIDIASNIKLGDL